MELNTLIISKQEKTTKQIWIDKNREKLNEQAKAYYNKRKDDPIFMANRQKSTTKSLMNNKDKNKDKNKEKMKEYQRQYADNNSYNIYSINE